MIAPNTPRSADVELWLHCDGKRYELGQVGRETLILAKPERIRGGQAEIETIIDGRSRRFPLGLLPDHSGESKRIQLAPSRS